MGQRNSILARNKIRQYKLDVPPQPVHILEEPTPRKLALLLFSLHHEKGLEPTMPLASYLRGASNFIKVVQDNGDCPFDRLKEAAGWARNPFTFKYAKEYYARHYLQNDPRSTK